MNHRKIAGMLLAAFAFTGAQAQNTTLTGDIKNFGDTRFMISYFDNGERKMDTVYAKAGKFTWKGNIQEPHKVSFYFPTWHPQFFFEPGNLQITGTADSLSRLKLTGSRLHDEAVAFTRTMADLDEREREVVKKYGKVSAAEQLEIERKFESIRTQRRERAMTYIAAHPKSPISVSLVNDRAAMGSYDELKSMFDMLDASNRESTIGKKIASRMELLKRSAIGATMLNFTQNDTIGKPVHFADFKGKYVLVDFWASWCGPCRAENPNVLKAYNQYKDKNFTVIGVSLDDDGEKWKKAIRDDAMPWAQVSDLKGFNNEVSSYYGIQGIPSTLLVDPQGKIIARNLRGAMLQDKLDELFK